MESLQCRASLAGWHEIVPAINFMACLTGRLQAGGIMIQVGNFCRGPVIMITAVTTGRHDLVLAWIQLGQYDLEPARAGPRPGGQARSTIMTVIIISDDTTLPPCSLLG